ncbi:MAG: hypothetical protein AMXMBFR84_42860 [Candidatus Hydrogenedentota bacterium]
MTTDSIASPRARFEIRHATYLATLFCLLVGPRLCAAAKEHRVVGMVAGQHIDAMADSPCVSEYVNALNQRMEMSETLDSAIKKADAAPLNAGTLRDLSALTSVDLATLYFTARLYRDTQNRIYQDAFAELTEHYHASGPDKIGNSIPLNRYTLAFVPGYGYKMDTSTGSDFARQRALMARLGIGTVLIETNETGTVEENATIIADNVRQLGEDGEEVIIVSASKGGPEVALALGEIMSHEDARFVKAWISIGGVLRGSPMADHMLGWPRRWLVATVGRLLGHPKGIAKNLSTDVRGEVFERIAIPEHILTVQYVGAPLCSQVRRETRKRYATLHPLGPNDGLTLLPDELVEGGIAVTDIGLDHYYRDSMIDMKTLALTQLVIGKLADRECSVALEK